MLGRLLKRRKSSSNIFPFSKIRHNVKNYISFCDYMPKYIGTRITLLSEWEFDLWFVSNCVLITADKTRKFLNKWLYLCASQSHISSKALKIHVCTWNTVVLSCWPYSSTIRCKNQAMGGTSFFFSIWSCMPQMYSIHLENNR